MHAPENSGEPVPLLVSRQARQADSQINAGGVMIGGGSFALIAGPCAVENREQLFAAAAAVRSAGGVMLRGGCFKPRTSPYAFRGLFAQGIALLKEARAAYGLPIVTEITDAATLDLFESVDMLQVGARSMQNYDLLHALGRSGKPVLLKRGAGATLQELLLSAEHILSAGNPNVILCERGIRTFENTHTRFTLDLSAVPVLKSLTHLPVLVDPSHAAGHARFVAPFALAAVAAGADGLLVEIHPDPPNALSDGEQALTLQAFAALARDIRRVREALMP